MKQLITIAIVVMFTSIALAQSPLTAVQKPLPLVNYKANVNLPLTSTERQFIDEVYAEFADKYVYANDNRLREIKNILRNRVIINEYPNKDLSSITNVSTIPLLKAFNPNLKSDVRINSENFNPLKYQFNFFSRESQIKYYRIDNTQLLISILPQHN